jgi:hypothetical protein
VTVTRRGRVVTVVGAEVVGVLSGGDVVGVVASPVVELPVFVVGVEPPDCGWGEDVEVLGQHPRIDNAPASASTGKANANTIAKPHTAVTSPPTLRQRHRPGCSARRSARASRAAARRDVRVLFIGDHQLVLPTSRRAEQPWRQHIRGAAVTKIFVPQIPSTTPACRRATPR